MVGLLYNERVDVDILKGLNLGALAHLSLSRFLLLQRLLIKIRFLF